MARRNPPADHLRAFVAALHPPAGTSESTRWLFCSLCIVSLALTSPALVSSARGPMLPVAIAAGMFLIASWIFGYLRRRTPLWCDIIDAVAFTGLALASPDPTSVVALIFAAVWFRALYGSLWRALLRCCLYAAGLGATLPAWNVIPGHDAPPAANPLLGVFPFLFLTLIVGRRLGGVLRAREESVRRNSVLAGTGSQLLAVTDAITIWALAWDAMVQICGAGHSLRIVQTFRDETGLHVLDTVGPFAAVPDAFPLDCLGPDRRQPERHEGVIQVRDPTTLNAAAGEQLAWVCVDLGDDAQHAQLLIGTAKRLSDDALLALRSLVNQVAMALRNSHVHHDLTVQARIDPLTKLANRASFTTELTALLTRGDFVDPVHVLFIDLDDFKIVNDLYGHHAGDEVLVEVAARLHAAVRPDDTCARLGGDEFALILPGGATADVEKIARRIVTSINEPIHLSVGAPAIIGASIGVATSTRQVDIDDLIHRADIAMYAAKAQGKGTIQFFDETLLPAGLSD